MALNFAIELDVAHLLYARLLCLAPFCPPWVGQRLVKQPMSPGALASVARGKMLPPTSAIDFYPRALDTHLTPAQIDTFVSCAPHRQSLFGSLFRPFERPRHRVTTRLTPCRELRFVRSSSLELSLTQSRGVIDHELCCRRTSDALFAPRKVDKNVSLCPATASFLTRQREDVPGRRSAPSTVESPSTKGLALRIRAEASLLPAGAGFAGDVRSPRGARALAARLPSHRLSSTDS